MTADRLWPDEAREAAIMAHAAARNVPFPNAKDERAVDAVLAALADHAVPRSAITAVLNEHWGDHTGHCLIHADVLRALTGGDQ